MKKGNFPFLQGFCSQTILIESGHSLHISVRSNSNGSVFENIYNFTFTTITIYTGPFLCHSNNKEAKTPLQPLGQG